MKNLILPIALIFSVAITSCQKEKITKNEQTDKNITAGAPSGSNSSNFLNLFQYFNTWNWQADQFQFQATTGGTFTTQKGSVLTIPADAFSFADYTLATGIIDISVREVYTTKEMINTGIYPVSNNQVLNSGGQFFIEATSNGNPLIVTNGELINFVIPAQAEDPNMDLFLAGPLEAEANWEPADSAWAGFTFNSADDTYSINLDSLGWGNIDVFMNVNYFDCTFNLTGLNNLDNTNTTAFAVFKDQNSVWPTGSNSGSIIGNVITETHLADVPMNIIVITTQNGQLFYGLLDVTPAQNTAYDINMMSTNSEALDIIIAGLE